MQEDQNKQPTGADKSEMPENVELQFQHTHSLKQEVHEELHAEQQAETSAPGEYKKTGMDRLDVGVEDTMIASDPPSTNMGEATPHQPKE